MTLNLFAMSLLSALVGLAASSAHAELAVGDDVPQFEMKGSDGKTYTAAQFKGKKASVIAWYPKAFTGG
jgi:peroxiredoxin Q/BCP